MAGRILVVDDVATNRIVMKVRLAEACYEVLQAATGEEALRLARRERPDLVLLDLKMEGLDGIAVCRRLKGDPATEAIPVIVVTAARDPGAKLTALEAGADDFMEKPLDEVTLLARVRSLLRAGEAARELALRDGTGQALGLAEPAAGFDSAARLALIAATRAEAAGWKATLAPHLPGTQLEVTDRATALSAAARPVDLYLLATDLDRPGAGLRLLPDLRARGASRHAGVVMVLPALARDTAAMALDLGANDMVVAPFDAEETALRLRSQIARKRQADRLRAAVDDGVRLAFSDPLTGLYNRRYALPHLARLTAHARETGRPFSVMLLDLDRFKSVNDRYGHAAGDAVLEALAERLRGALRPADMAARIGGEEFLVTLPETGAQEALAIAERLRRAVADEAVRLPGGATLTVSVSIGLAPAHGADETAEALIARADTALYDAKAAGRDRVRIGQPSAA